MLRKFGLLGLALATLLLSPSAASARRHDERGRRFEERYEHRERGPHFRNRYYVEPIYPYEYRYWWGDPTYGFYDRWGVWHPYR
jgi:hypothetical protein